MIKNTRNANKISRFETEEFDWPTLDSDQPELFPLIAEEAALEDEVSMDTDDEEWEDVEEEDDEPEDPAVNLFGRETGK